MTGEEAGLFGLSTTQIEKLEEEIEEKEEKEKEEEGEVEEGEEEVDQTLLEVLGLTDEGDEEEEEKEKKEKGKKEFPSKKETKDLSPSALETLLEEMKVQNEDTQEELRQLHAKLEARGEKEEDPLEGIEDDDTITKATLVKALGREQKRNNQLSLMISATNTKIQEIELKGDDAYSDYGELAKKYFEEIKGNERLASMVANSSNPPKAFYKIAKQLAKKAKGEEGGDLQKRILQALKEGKDAARGAGKKKTGKGKPSLSGGKKKAVGDAVLKIAQEGSAEERKKLLNVPDSLIFGDEDDEE